MSLEDAVPCTEPALAGKEQGGQFRQKWRQMSPGDGIPIRFWRLDLDHRVTATPARLLVNTHPWAAKALRKEPP